MFTYAHVKWFYGQSERAYYLNYFIKKTYVQCLLYRFIHNPKDFDFISSFLPGKVSQHHYSIKFCVYVYEEQK